LAGVAAGALAGNTDAADTEADGAGEPAGAAEIGGAPSGFWGGRGFPLERTFAELPAEDSSAAQPDCPPQSTAIAKRATGRLGRLFMFFGKYGIYQRFRHERSENTIVRRSRGSCTFPTDHVLKGMKPAGAEITAAPHPKDMHDERGF
jgi:hypothetical protein